jgi:hypothetical protein
LVPLEDDLAVVSVNDSCLVLFIVIDDVNAHKFNFFADLVIVCFVLVFHHDSKDAEKLVELALFVVNAYFFSGLFAVGNVIFVKWQSQFIINLFFVRVALHNINRFSK